MVPSLYCVYRVPGYGTVFVFSLFLFTGVVQPTQVLLYWSRNNKIENRIFCPQESTIAISRCLLLLPAVFNLRVVPFTYQTSNVVFCFCVWPHSFFKFEVWIILLFFDQQKVNHRTSHRHRTKSRLSIALPSSFKRVPAIRSAPTRWQK